MSHEDLDPTLMILDVPLQIPTEALNHSRAGAAPGASTRLLGLKLHPVGCIGSGRDVSGRRFTGVFRFSFADSGYRHLGFRPVRLPVLRFLQ